MDVDILEKELLKTLQEFDEKKKHLPGGASCYHEAVNAARREAFKSAAKRLRLAMYRASTASQQNVAPRRLRRG